MCDSTYLKFKTGKRKLHRKLGQHLPFGEEMEWWLGRGMSEALSGSVPFLVLSGQMSVHFVIIHLCFVYFSI